MPLELAPGQLPGAELRDRKAAADLPDERVADLGMSGDRFDGAGGRFGPEGMGGTFALQDAAVPSQMPEQAAALHGCSVHNDDLALGTRWNAPQAFFAAILQDEGDSLRQALSGFVPASALAVGARHLRTVRDVPLTVAFEHGRELIAHG
jgi:hypothetical protein